jgi:NADPH-dependent 2,4-dienoyl-CoA reductase/sulfur reductase-like enzyme
MLAELQRRRVPVLFGHALLGIDSREGGLVARLGSGFVESVRFEVDAVCMGYGFLPANELLRALGCRHRFDARRGHLVTERDADCATSAPGVYAVGDCCGLGGARAAAAEGIIAGIAVAGRAPPPELLRERDTARRKLARHSRFQDALWRLFAAPRPQPTPETLCCRCESVTFAQIEAALLQGRPSIGEVKRRTRVGMGSCQGRYCAPLLAELLAQRQFRKLDDMALFAPQAPVKPVTIAELSRPDRP